MEKIKLPANIVLVGSTGSGKSYGFKHKILPMLEGQYDKLIICSPTLNVNGDYDDFEADEKTIFKVEDDISGEIKGLIKQQKLIFKSYQKGHIKKNQIPRLLVVLDDCLNETMFDSNRGFLPKFAIMSRHYYISFVIMAQRAKGVPRTLRINSAYMFLYTVLNYSELEAIIEEYIPKKFKKQFLDKCLEIYSVKYNHLFINNRNQNIHERIYLNGTELIKFE